MSLLSSSRPTMQSVCRSCRQRLFTQPQSISFIQSFSLSTSKPTSDDTTQAPTSFARKTLNVAFQHGQHTDDPEQHIPRWKRTPPAMKAPVRLNEKNANMDFPVNEDPRKLDEIYVKLLGKGGDQWLPEEVKWLAVTHKSFDYGRRGFNDRLAYLGRRIVELQISLALLDAPQPTDAALTQADKFGRTPFHHPSLANIEEITKYKKTKILSKERIAQLAVRYGLDTVTRWKPKQVGRLKASGIDVVLNQTLYAVIGGVATQMGGDVAAKIAKERVLQPLGVIAA